MKDTAAAPRALGEQQMVSLLADAQRIGRMGIWDMDLRTNRLRWSDETCALFGIQPQAFGGQFEDFAGFIVPEDRAQFGTSPDASGAFENEYRIRRSDGTIRWLYERGTVQTDAAGTPIRRFGMVMDITERKLAERRQQLAVTVMEAVSLGMPLPEVLEKIVHGVEDLMGNCVASVLVMDDDRKRLRHGAAPHLPADYTRQIDGLIVAAVAGSCGTAAFRRAPVHVADMLVDPLWGQLRPQATTLRDSLGLRACWSTPVHDPMGGVLATVAVYHRETRTPTAADEQIIEHASHLVRLVLERDRRERRLAASEGLLRIAGKVARVGGWSVDLRTEVIHWSDEVCAMHGMPAGTQVDVTRGLSYYVAEHRPRVQAAFEACARTGVPFDVEAQIAPAGGGELLWVRAIGEPVRGPGGRIDRVEGALQDIGKLKEAESKLHREEALLQLAGKIAKVAGWSMSVPDRKLYWSKQIWDIVDYPTGREPVLAEVLPYYLPESRERLTLAIDRCGKEGTPFDLELEAITPAGRHLWARVAGEADRDEHGIIRAVHGAFSDITQQKATELTIRRAAERWEATLASITDAFFTLDREWRFTYLNREAERLLHRGAADLLGRNVWAEFPEAVGSAFEREYLRAVTDRVTVGFEEWYPPLQTWFEVRAYPSEEGVAVYFRDITQRRRNEEQLRLLQTCIARINDVVIITEAEPVDEPGPRIVYVNDAFEARTGYTREEVLGRSLRLLRGPRTSGETLARIRAALLEVRPLRADVVNRAKTGEDRWTEIDLMPVRNAAGRCTHWAWIERDVTERREAEEQLRQSEARFRELAENIEEVFYNYDPVAERQLYVSPAFEKLWGRPVTDIYADPHVYLACIHPDDQPLARRALQQHSGGQTTDITYRVQRPDGTVRWVHDRSIPVFDDAGQVIRVVGSARDITENKEATERLADQAALLDAAHEGILVKDLDARITFWNKGAARIYGWSAEEAIGQRATELLRESDAEHARAFAALLEHGEWNGELVKRTKDGRELIVEVRWTLLRDAAGRPKSVLSINSDVTERRKLEQQFLRSQRMESIGTLAGGIAHDLNNILAPIMIGLNLLRLSDSAKQQETLILRMEQSARRGADLVKQVLSFARGVEGARVGLELKHIVREIETILFSTFPKQINVTVNVSAAPWNVLGDPTQIHQVLLNLCVNARDAMPAGGRLAIEVENRAIDEQYAAMHRGVAAGRYVALTVRDSGSGIPSEILDRIFDPFFTTKEIGKGTGLGLSTVLGIVRSHGGFVNVQSDVGKGSAFTVFLPAQSEQATVSPADAAAPEEEYPRGNGELILVVDDESVILQVTRQTLETYGYRVVVAEDGAQAVAVFAGRMQEISLVLTDVMMPLMDGAALVAALRRLSPTLPIIATTGLNAAQNVAKLNHAGVQHVLAKPFSTSPLLRTIRRALSGTSRPPFPVA